MTETGGLRSLVQNIMDELHALSVLEDPASLSIHEDLLAEVEEFRDLVARPETTPDTILAVAVGLVEHYVNARWAALESALGVDRL